MNKIGYANIINITNNSYRTISCLQPRRLDHLIGGIIIGRMHAYATERTLVQQSATATATDRITAPL
jgi:hypothetical protein